MPLQFQSSSERRPTSLSLRLKDPGLDPCTLYVLKERTGLRGLKVAKSHTTGRVICQRFRKLEYYTFKFGGGNQQYATTAGAVLYEQLTWEGRGSYFTMRNGFMILLTLKPCQAHEHRLLLLFFLGLLLHNLSQGHGVVPTRAYCSSTALIAMTWGLIGHQETIHFVVSLN